jgi:hypothetical protein
MPEKHLNYGEWALRVLAWDAVLPICVALLPMGVELLFPDHRGAIELTAVALPVTAFPLRAWAGIHHIKSNYCSYKVKIFQLGVFFLGVLPLALLDSVLIMSHLLPGGAWGNKEIWTILRFGIMFYFIFMVVAMYPGRTGLPQTGPDDLFVYHDTWMDENIK